MLNKVRPFILKAVNHTPFEHLIRKAYSIIVPSKGNQYDKYTYEIMKNYLKKDSNCIDVGAYRGEILHFMRKYAPDGQHFAYEPIKENYDFLVRKFKKDKIFNAAVSNSKGVAIFKHVVGRPARSGFKEVIYPDSDQVVQEVRVKTVRIDDTIPHSKKVDLIKIDVEGAEYLVLDGARELISKDKPLIIMEFELEKSLVYKCDANKMYNTLDDFGFETFLLKDYIEGNKSLSRRSFISISEKGDEFYFVSASR
jgi:FkbM family methyltransferase